MILLVEDDTDDVFLFRRILSQLDFRGSVRVVGSVSDACDYLEGHGDFTDRDHYKEPDLIVADMLLTDTTGNVLLEWVRADTRFKSIPFAFLAAGFPPRD